MFTFEDFDITDKNRNVHNQIKLMLDRTNTIFEWEGLPETVPAWIMEIMLQTKGHVLFTEWNSEFYALSGNWADKKNAYYMPTGYIVENPWINCTKNFTINTLNGNDEGVLIRNDSTCTGLLPILNKYSSLMADNEITMRMADINMRMFNQIVASDDDSAESARLYQKQIEEGKLSIIADNGLFEGVNISSGASAGAANYLTQLIEYHQYLKAGVFNELGLQSNQNMKRERLNTAEVNADEPTLQPLIDNMLLERQKACELINNMYNLNVSVKLSGAWEEQEELTDAEESTESADTNIQAAEETEPEGTESKESDEQSNAAQEDEGEVDLQEVEDILQEVEDILQDAVEEIKEEKEDEKTEDD